MDVQQKERFVKIQVRDYGIGIEPGEENAVFSAILSGKTCNDPGWLWNRAVSGKRNCQQASGLSYDQKKRKRSIDRNKSSFRIVRSLLDFVCILTAKKEEENHGNGKSDRAEKILCYRQL